MPGLVIFDLDGTLVDSRADLAAAGNAARRSVGLEDLACATIAGYVGDGVERLLERLIGSGDLDQARQAFHAHYDRHCCDQTRAYPGISEALAILAERGWHCGVATNKPEVFARRIIAAVGLAGLIGDRIIGGDRHRKPEPQQLLALLQMSGVPPQQAWMVGDHHTDIRAARAAGLRCCWCAWGLGHDGGDAVDAVAASAWELPTCLGYPP